MNELTCPNCGKVFKVDEAGYAQIVKQVRDAEFKFELQQREKEFAERRDNEIKLKLADQENKAKDYLAKKDEAIANLQKQVIELKAKLDNADAETKLAVTEAVASKAKELSDKNIEITELSGEIDRIKAEQELKLQSQKEKFKTELQAKDEQIAFYKDFKAKQSTKMVGESLEQHCQIQFNQIRMTAFPNAYFEKDNDAKTGSKGDFIFRETSDDGVDFISIMFEMKNEMDTTATKHKNEDFFKELDKDRREKNCEYAVLVSLLEPDNELYNNGIVDVSYRYEKMYVIRPQFFIPIITLLRNAALNSLKYRQELQVEKTNNLI